MSSSTRSKPASESSPAGGSDDAAAAAASVDGDGDGATNKPSTEPIAIELEPSRSRFVSWAIFGTAFGALLVWKLGTVGVWAGWVLIALGVIRLGQLIKSFVYAPGTIEVADDKVVLPRGLHASAPVTVKPADVTAVYFLRRSVPWNRAAPVLVVETGPRAFLYPRDWFASEADQRHIVHALVARKPSA